MVTRAHVNGLLFIDVRFRSCDSIRMGPTIADQIDTARRVKRLKIKDLAAVVGIKPQHLGRKLLGAEPLRTREAEALVVFLGIVITYPSPSPT